MNNLHGIVFGYSTEHQQGLRELVDHRTAPSIPFGGRYRLIDFVISTMTNAGITDIGVLMEERYQSLLDHLGAGKDWDLSRKLGGLKLLPPFALAESHRHKGSNNYFGVMDALSSVRTYVERIRQDYVAIADAMTVANFDLAKVFENHLQMGADVTAVCLPDDRYLDATVRFKFGQDGWATDVKICKDGSLQHADGIAGLGFYILSKELLLSMIDDCAEHGEYDFESGVLLRHLSELKIGSYIVPVFAARPETTQLYYELSMKLLDSQVRRDLFPRDRTVKTKVRDEAPTYYSPDSRSKNCLVADGCYIEGDVEDSIIFRGVKIHPGAKVKGCILMQDTVVEAGAELQCVITDKDTRIKEGRMLMGHESYPIVISKGSEV